MKFPIPFLSWTGRAALEVEIPDGTDDHFRLRAAVEVAVKDHARLDYASLVGASLNGARLDHASLVGASLDHARLVGASLNGASLDHARLVGASLDHARLDHARLVGASLDHASLVGASLNGASLTDTIWQGDIKISRPPLYVGALTWPIFILDQHMQIGCELHTLAEWAAFDNERIASMDGVASRKFWKRHKDALLALAASDGRGVAMPAEEATSET
jgi:hypothetical protein